jgi:hypothetical protein
MPARSLGYWQYVKAAFKRRARVPLLGYVPYNYIAIFAFAILGAASQNPGFWFMGGALEIGYLAALAGNPRFQKLVEGEALLKARPDGRPSIQQTVNFLTPPSAERYRRIFEQCRLILGINAPLQSAVTLKDSRAESLNSLLSLFVRLLSSRETLLGTLGLVDKKTLEGDVERLKQKLATTPPDGALARSVQATLEIETKRLENLARAKGSLEVIDAELERIEQQVRLIREESAVSGGPEVLSARLDAVSTTLTETSKWMDQHAELFTTLSADDALGEAPSPPPQPLGAQIQRQ